MTPTLLPIITVDNLLAVLQTVSTELKPDDDPITLDDAIWFACIGKAEDTADYSTKDIAHLFRDGIPACNTAADVQQYLDDFYGNSSFCPEITNVHLHAGVRHFLGGHQQAEKLYMNAREMEDNMASPYNTTVDF